MADILLKGHKLILVALVDDEDYERVSRLKWHAKIPQSGIIYAHSAANRQSILMHRYILGLKYGDKRIVDHINRNGLDNRRSNIRVASWRLNNLNKSRIPDLVDELPSGKFRARISFNRRMIHLGVYKTREEALEIARKYRNET